MKNAKQISGTAAEETRRQLAFIENPAERLRLLFQKNLKTDALMELHALVDKGIFFENPSRGHGIQIDLFKFDRSEKADSIVYSLDQSCFFTIPGIAKFFGWKERQTRSFIDRLLAKMIEFDPTNLRLIASWCGSWEINATRRVFEQYRPKDKKFTDRVERWILLAYFYDGPYFTNGLGEEWYAKWLGITIPRSTFIHHDEPGAVEEQVDHNAMKYRALSVRLEELGMSAGDVHEAFFMWIEKFKKSGLDLYYMAAVLESRVLSHHSGGTRLTKLMCELTDTVLQSYMGYIGTVIANHGMKSDPTLRTKLIGWLADKLAEGRIAYAYQINYLVGEAFFGKYLKRDTELKLDECAALAFDKAVTAGNFGVAAALAQQFGEDKCFNEKVLTSRVQGKNQRDRKQSLKHLVEERKTQIRECVGIAQAANQPIRLEYNCCFLRPY
jgi:hypothetical protein